MNLLFFLTPKQDVLFIYEDFTLRQTLEKWSNQRFTSYEIVETTPVMVIKKDGSREAFSHDKLLRGVLKSCEKRPVTLAQLEAMVSEIEVELQNRMDREVPSAVIGELVMDKLKKIDQVAYVRFASVYREFKDIQSFLEELKVILEHEKN